MKKYLLALLAFALVACSSNTPRHSKNGGVSANSKAESNKKLCDSGNMDGCYNLGVFYYKGKEGVEQDYFKASELYKKVCDNGDSEGCNNLGYMYFSGIGVKKDTFKAGKLYKKACERGATKACQKYKKYFFTIDRFPKTLGK